MPTCYQILRSSPTGTVSCREPGADCRAGEDRDTGHALIGDIGLSRGRPRREIAAFSQRSA
jgi:hypothetical protein